MIGRSRLMGAAVGAGLAATVVAGCGTPSDGKSASDGTGPIKVGVIQALSGPLAPTGQGLLAGIRAEVDLLNRHGGLLGRQIKLEIRDDGSDAQRARVAAQELVKMKDMAWIVPSVGPSSPSAVLPLTNQAKILTASTCAYRECLDPNANPYNFSSSIPIETQTDALVAGAKAAGVKNVGFIVSEDAQGDIMVDHGTQRAGADGIRVAGAERFSPKATDIAPQLQKLRTKGADGLIMYGGGSVPGVLMRSMRDLSWKAPVFASVASTGANVAELIPRAVWSQFRPITYRAMVRVNGELPAAVQPLVDQIEAGKGVPGQSSLLGPVLGSDTVRYMAYGIEKAKSLDADKVKAALESEAGDSAASDVSRIVGNPRISGKYHYPGTVKCSDIFAVVHLQPLGKDGAFVGKELACE